MSNTQAPFGFRPVQRVDGAAPNYKLSKYNIAYNNAHQIGKGDPVYLPTGGYIDLLAPGSTNVLGIFWGCEYLTPGVARTNWYNAWTAPTLPSTTVVTAWVIDDPDMLFAVQAGGSASVGFAASNLGDNVQFAGGGAPGLAGFSVAYADVTTVTNTSTLPFRIYSISEQIGVDPLSAYNQALVRLNFGQLNNTTGNQA